MSNLKDEVILELPWATVDVCNGFGLDFGGSVCKVIYIHNDDWKEPDQRTKETVSLRCINISRVDFEKGLEFLKDRVCIRRKTPEEKPLVFTTGIGGSQYGKTIQDTFNVRTENITEMDCHMIAFNHVLKTMKTKELVHDLNQPLIQKTIDINRNRNKLMKQIFAECTNWAHEEPKIDIPTANHPQETPYEDGARFTDKDDIFPCILVMLGSNGGSFVVHEDGTYELANDYRRAGRAFLGLASLLSGEKTYDDVMGSIEKGSMLSVHEYNYDIMANAQDDTENLYSVIKEMEFDDPMFLFGKAVFKNRDCFKKEDLARSFHYSMVTDIVQTTHFPLSVYPKVRNVFFSGGFPGHKFTRDAITKEWIRSEAQSVTMYGSDHFCNTHFLKHGAYMGALGAYLNPMLKFIKSTTEQ